MYINWDNILDKLQVMLVYFVIGLYTICTATLILFDVMAGTGIMTFLTSKNIPASVVISLATTGLLLALMFIGYTLVEKSDGRVKAAGWSIAFVALIVYCVDVVFDSLAADVLRFGTIMVVKDIPNPAVHWMFRFLIGGISTVGEALAISIIFGMPVLKKLINNALPKSYTHQQYQPNLRKSNDPVIERNRIQADREARFVSLRNKSRPAPAYHPVDPGAWELSKTPAKAIQPL